MNHSRLSGWQKLCTKGLRRKVWTRTKIQSQHIRYFVAISRSVAGYALFGNLWAKKKCFLRSANSNLWFHWFWSKFWFEPFTRPIRILIENAFHLARPEKRIKPKMIIYVSTTNLSIEQFYNFDLWIFYRLPSMLSSLCDMSLLIQYSGSMAFGMGIKVCPIPGYCY